MQNQPETQPQRRNPVVVDAGEDVLDLSELAVITSVVTPLGVGTANRVEHQLRGANVRYDVVRSYAAANDVEALTAPVLVVDSADSITDQVVDVLMRKAAQAVAEGAAAPTRHIVLLHGRIDGFALDLPVEDMLQDLPRGSYGASIADWATGVYVDASALR